MVLYYDTRLVSEYNASSKPHHPNPWDAGYGYTVLVADRLHAPPPEKSPTFSWPAFHIQDDNINILTTFHASLTSYL